MCYNIHPMKMRGIRNIILGSLAVILVSASYSSVAFAATLDELNSQKSQLSQDITNLQNAAENKEKEAQTLSKQISNIENDIKSTENKIESTGQSLNQTQSEIDALSGKIDTRKKELELLKKKLNASLVEIYRSSMKSEYELILGATSLSQSSNEKNYLQAVEGQVKILHTKVTEAKTALETQKSDQEKKKAELEELKKQQEAYRQSVTYQKTTKDKLLNMTVAQEAEYNKKAEQACAELAKVENRIISQLAARRANSSGYFGSGPGVGSRVEKGDYIGIQGSTGFSTGDHVHFEVDLHGPANGNTSPWPYINSGQLDWPLSSFVITQNYGRTDFSHNYSSGSHMGIDIAGPLGSPVFSPGSGTVVLNEYFGGYGNAWCVRLDTGEYVLIGHMR